MEVALSAGTATDAKGIPAMPSVDGTYQSDRFGGGTVVATITNPFDVDLKNLKVTAVTYGADGKINGGWFTYLNLLPASGRAVASISFLAAPSGPPVKVVIYPSISSLTLLDCTEALGPVRYRLGGLLRYPRTTVRQQIPKAD